MKLNQMKLNPNHQSWREVVHTPLKPLFYILSCWKTFLCLYIHEACYLHVKIFVSLVCMFMLILQNSRQPWLTRCLLAEPGQKQALGCQRAGSWPCGPTGLLVFVTGQSDIKNNLQSVLVYPEKTSTLHHFTNAPPELPTPILPLLLVLNQYNF